MQHSDELDQIAPALAQAQAELQDVQKTSEGYKFDYADLATVLAEIRPKFAKHGIALVQSPSTTVLEGTEFVMVGTMLLHKSGQYISDSIRMAVEPMNGVSHAQSIGAVITYARRYSAAAIAGLAQRDADLDDLSHTATSASGKPTQVQAVQGTISQAEADALKKLIKEAGGTIKAFCEKQGIKTVADLPRERIGLVVPQLKGLANKAKEAAA